VIHEPPLRRLVTDYDLADAEFRLAELRQSQ
jgi:hypothetical protein